MSLFYGVANTTLALIFVFSLDHSKSVKTGIPLNRECTRETRAFIWLYLVLVTEFMIFGPYPKVRLQSLPSTLLTPSMLLSCVARTLICSVGFRPALGKTSGGSSCTALWHLLLLTLPRYHSKLTSFFTSKKRILTVRPRSTRRRTFAVSFIGSPC